jgi:hypothetical protein
MSEDWDNPRPPRVTGHLSVPGMITMDTAHKIWSAHREIEVGKKLQAEIEKAIKDGTDPTPIDPFSRRRNFQLGVPSGDSSHRLFDLSPQLAIHIIEAHIANKQRELAEACVIAKLDLASPKKAEQ